MTAQLLLLRKQIQVQRPDTSRLCARNVVVQRTRRVYPLFLPQALQLELVHEHFGGGGGPIDAVRSLSSLKDDRVKDYLHVIMQKYGDVGALALPMGMDLLPSVAAAAIASPASSPAGAPSLHSPSSIPGFKARRVCACVFSMLVVSSCSAVGLLLAEWRRCVWVLAQKPVGASTAGDSKLKPPRKVGTSVSITQARPSPLSKTAALTRHDAVLQGICCLMPMPVHPSTLLAQSRYRFPRRCCQWMTAAQPSRQKPCRTPRRLPLHPPWHLLQQFHRLRRALRRPRLLKAQ